MSVGSTLAAGASGIAGSGSTSILRVVSSIALSSSATTSETGSASATTGSGSTATGSGSGSAATGSGAGSTAGEGVVVCGCAVVGSCCVILPSAAKSNASFCVCLPPILAMMRSRLSLKKSNALDMTLRLGVLPVCLYSSSA